MLRARGYPLEKKFPKVSANQYQSASAETRQKQLEKLDKLEEQRRELEVTVIMAQCRLGELTSSLQKAKNQYEVPSQEVGKQQQLAKIGIISQRASEYERMASHPEAVQRISTEQKSATMRNSANQNPKPSKKLRKSRKPYWMQRCR